MDIRPVLELEERVARARHFKAVYRDKGIETIPLRKFLAHLTGLEQLVGKRVLEIGGTDRMHMASYFFSIGAMYQCVRLEGNPQAHPWVLSVRDFRDIPRNEHYDCIISLGVFEMAAIDRSTNGDDYRGFFDDSMASLRRLFDLTNKEGVNLIGTISHPCMFSDAEIAAAGFCLQHREKPFYSLSGKGYAEHGKNSELVILRK